MLCDFDWLSAFCYRSSMCWKLCLFAFYFECFLSIFYLWQVCLKHVLPFTFVLMALCIYERSLLPMHSYLSGRNLNIYVTVVNRFSNLSWMISQWYCWSWDMHRLVPIYLHTHLFDCFCLKSSPNEKRYWSIKACRTY